MNRGLSLHGRMSSEMLIVVCLEHMYSSWLANREHYGFTEAYKRGTKE